MEKEERKQKIEELSKKAGNKYKLCVLVSKRAEEIQKHNYEEGINPEVKEITQACNEIMEGKLELDENKKVIRNSHN